MKALKINQTIEPKVGTVDQAVMRYGFGKNTIRKIAEDAGSIIRIGKCVRVNFTILDRYFDELAAGKGEV